MDIKKKKKKRTRINQIENYFTRCLLKKKVEKKVYKQLPWRQL